MERAAERHLQDSAMPDASQESQGIYKSRRSARACEERTDFMPVTGLDRHELRTVSIRRFPQSIAHSTLAASGRRILAGRRRSTGRR
jgi:hypothetical protein